MLRPDTYVGSLEKTDGNFWVLNAAETQFHFTEVNYVPALYKIFDEVIVNASDNNSRDCPMSYIKVEIDQERGSISVENDGKGTDFSSFWIFQFFKPKRKFPNSED